MREVGYYCLIIALMASLLSLVLGVPCKKIKARANKIAFDCFLAQVFFVVGAFASLLICYLTDDFTNLLVASNSSFKMPLFYKIAAMWSSHQGSLLLWELYILVFGFSLFYFRLRTEEYRFVFLRVQGLVSLFFLFLLSCVSNPFEELYPRAVDGQGLNPILADIALAIHPPVLFAAYAGFATLYSLSIASANKVQQSNFHELWLIRITFAFMTLAIALGSWWAYRELGWGGFWFWDPVENSSLLPWLTSLALLHFAQGNKLHKTQNNLYGALGFVFALIATFLVRSGLLTSVHSFASDASKGLAILIGICFFLLYAIYQFFQVKKSYISDEEKSGNILLSINLVLVLTYLATVFFGTVAPLFYEALYGDKISVGSNYFNQISQIFVYIALFFMIFASLPKFSKFEAASSIIFSLIISFVFVSFANYFLSITNFASLLTLVLSVWIMISQIFAMTDNKEFLGRQMGMYIAHFAFALLMLAITIRYEKSFDLEEKIHIGDARHYRDDFYMKFTSLDRGKKDDYMYLAAEFDVWHYKSFLGTLKPEIRFYRAQEIKVNEASLLRVGYLNDLYATIEKYDESDYFYLRLQYRPLMSLIWLSMVLISISVFLSFRKRKQ
jgi:cytochrome c-type biogenesis protein CcmF